MASLKHNFKSANILWFKRDLRVFDNLPLIEATKNELPLIPLYVIEPNYWKQDFSSRRHWYFISDCLQELREELEYLGQPLIVRKNEVIDVLNEILQKFKLVNIYTHEETGNEWVLNRNKNVKKFCEINDINLIEFQKNGVFRGLDNRDNWSKLRNEKMKSKLIKSPVSIKGVNGIEIGNIPSKDNNLFGEKIFGVVQKGGRKEAIKILNTFLNSRVKNYISDISSPSFSATSCSRLSPHLSWGTLSVREVLYFSKQKIKSIKNNSSFLKKNIYAFTSRLSWRCHFIQKLADKPEIEKKCIHPFYENIRPKKYDEFLFNSWKDGMTGYPFVDACMRSLTYEGWINFRMRAMLISFASYNLWIDWRITGKHLAKLFTDYDPGIHYSQLQMQSGVTGINSIRIYNPVKQSQEHDPKGEFIKKWVPELRDVPITFIHEPWNLTLKQQTEYNCQIKKDYPIKIVDYKKTTLIAKKHIFDVKKRKNFEKESSIIYEKIGSRKIKKDNSIKNKIQKKQLSFLF